MKNSMIKGDSYCVFFTIAIHCITRLVAYMYTKTNK